MKSNQYLNFNESFKNEYDQFDIKNGIIDHIYRIKIKNETELWNLKLEDEDKVGNIDIKEIQ